MEVWEKVIPSETARWLHAMGRLSNEAFSFPGDLWVRLVYDFAVAFHRGSIHRDHLLKSMIPLYLGRVASFVKEHRESSGAEVERKIESLCELFETLKPYLIARWDKR